MCLKKKNHIAALAGFSFALPHPERERRMSAGCLNCNGCPDGLIAMSGKCSGLEEYQNVLSLFYSNTFPGKKENLNSYVLYRNTFLERRVCSLN